MRNKLLSLLALAVLATIAACAPETSPQLPTPEYRAEIDRWRSEREAELRQDDGWLTLVGLHWLEQGDNTFGSDPSSDLVFPPGTAADLGVLRLEGEAVSLVAAPESGIRFQGEPVTRIDLAADTTEEPTVLELGSIRFFLIDREGRLGIRVKDTASPLLASFAGMEYFPIDPTWRITAAFEAFDEPRTIKVPNIIGTASEELVAGRARFERAGRWYELTPVGESDGELFFVFGDTTNRRETYGGGRFLYADAPVEGALVLDFNKAYNPPCVFTPYATCPLPPAENKLALAVTAGERNWGAGH